MAEALTAREVAIMDAALGVFRRYGFKKTSMDDLARAVGLSRQGLYLHFPTKEALFKATVERVLDATDAAGRAALDREDLSVEERLLGAFVTVHGFAVGQQEGAENWSELFDTARLLMGPRVAELEARFTAGLVGVLRASDIAAGWKEAGISGKQLAELLLTASTGAKHTAKNDSEYRDAMRLAIRLVCRGRAQPREGKG